mmetsp:Transcript_3843/g.12842  ORF Transcript_3843/g.12842 Transcript_3843/m.12842 type:complete len:219 (+) Transcript_3843:302-958(+)
MQHPQPSPSCSPSLPPYQIFGPHALQRCACSPCGTAAAKVGAQDDADDHEEAGRDSPPPDPQERELGQPRAAELHRLPLEGGRQPVDVPGEGAHPLREPHKGADELMEHLEVHLQQLREAPEGHHRPFHRAQASVQRVWQHGERVHAGASQEAPSEEAPGTELRAHAPITVSSVRRGRVGPVPAVRAPSVRGAVGGKRAREACARAGGRLRRYERPGG